MISFSLLFALGSRLALVLALGKTPETGYQPYTPPARMDAGTPSLFIVIAYSAMWVVLLFYLLSIWLRQRRLERELRRLEQEVKGGSGSRSRPGSFYAD